MKYYIIAGEASGDLHAAGLIKAMKGLDPGSEFRAWGGDLMEEAGADIVKHYRDLAFMGFLEVLQNLRTIRNNLHFCRKDILSWNPDAIILVDYPGFNLRIAAFAHKMGIPVYYYISPQVWAWKKSRVKKIKRTVDRMFVILPFEKAFYAGFDYEVEFVGHPLLDAIAAFEENKISTKANAYLSEDDKSPLIAILPGSRKQEIQLILPIMLEMTKRFCDVQFVLAEAPSIPEEFYDVLCKDFQLKRIRNKTYSILSDADAALVASGTASLETALFEVPQVICYQGNPVSFAIARQIVNIPFIGLPNLILNRQIVRELVQNDFSPDVLEQELYRLLYDEDYINRMKSDFKELKQVLEGPGAGLRTARGIFNHLQIRKTGAKSRVSSH